MPTREELHKGFKLGDWEVLPARREFHRGDEVVRPEPKQLDVLMSLAMRDGDAVTRDELVDECWDGRPTADEPINRSISQLRKHLGDEKPYQYIDALVKTGYCLKQPVILNEPDEHVPERIVIKTRKVSRIWAVVAALAIAAVIVWVIIDDGPRPPPGPITSIAVLPFKNLTGDPSNAVLAEGFKEELGHTLQNVPELAIKNVTVPPDDESYSVFGRGLGVGSVLIGALRIEGEELKFSFQLVRVADGVNISSGQVGGPRSELFNLQEEVAILVRDHIVGDSDQQLLSLSRPENPVAYDRYMFGQYSLERRGIDDNLEKAIALFDESIRLDPSYGPAYLALAESYVLSPDYLGADVVESNEKAIQIVEQGIAADPAIEDAAAAVYGFVYHKQKRWAEAEQAFIRATSARVVESNAFNWYSLMLGSVGRLDDALQQVLAAIEIDPDSALINSRVAVMYTWIGDSENAGEYFERSEQLGGGSGTHLLAHALFLYRQGELEEARRLTIAGVLAGGGTTAWVDSVFEALADPAQRETALIAIDQAAADGEFNPQIELTLRLMFGDSDGALQVARELVQPGATYETDLLFLPENLSLRQRPEFLELMTALKVTEYWEQTGCVWKNLAVECD